MASKKSLGMFGASSKESSIGTRAEESSDPEDPEMYGWRKDAAEEAADEVWVRYDPHTRRVITVDVLNYSARVRAVFGPTLTYTERTDPQRLESLRGLPLPTEDEEA